MAVWHRFGAGLAPKMLRLVEAPLRSVEAPLRSLEAPLRSLEAPLRSLEAPLRLVEAPLRSVEAPLRSVGCALFSKFWGLDPLLVELDELNWMGSYSLPAFYVSSHDTHAITKHDHNVIVQTVSVAHTVKTSITWCIPWTK